jgi:hypothetical protein
MIHHLFFAAPSLSPTRPTEVPRRKERRDVKACWSGLWKVLSEVEKRRATARES